MNINKTVRTALFIMILVHPALIYPDELDAYLKMKGTQDEKKILQTARDTILSYLRTGRVDEQKPSLSSPWPGRDVGVFVTLVKERRVRGCVGSFSPEERGFLQTVMNTAVRSTYFDTRFPPLEIEEVPDIRIIVSVTGRITNTDDPYSVDFFTHGVLIKQGNRSAVLLPGEAKTVNWGIQRLMKESGIEKNNVPIEYYTFKTVTFEEK
jgi:AMMECR1 domain-containing protein